MTPRERIMRRAKKEARELWYGIGLPLGLVCLFLSILAVSGYCVYQAVKYILYAVFG